MNIKDVEIFMILGTALTISLIAFIIIVIILYRRSQLKFELEKQALHQALLETEVEIREQTLTNISRDLHDNFGQIASLIKINLNLLSPELRQEDQVRVDESKDLLKKLIGDIRALSYALSEDTVANQGLSKMIASDLERVKRSGALEVEFHQKYEEDNLDSQTAIFLYRMFQELLNNALKHSQATMLKVVLKGEGKNLDLEVSDNGVGIPMEKFKTDKHGLSGNGLLNLKERCKMIGAIYNISSEPNQGTSIVINLN